MDENTKPEVNFNKYLGYKFFKEKEDGSFDILRICEILKDKNSVRVITENNTKSVMTIEDLSKEYTPLEPFGIMSFNIVSLGNTKDKSKDVMVMMYKLTDLKLGIEDPFAICRQSINDFFADLLCNNPLTENNLVGVCCSRENCPTGIKFNILAACDDLISMNVVNIYRGDTLKDIMQCVPILKEMDNTLNKLFITNCKAENVKGTEFLTSHNGWCKDLKTLFKENNAQGCLDEMMGITDVDFNLSNYFDKRDSGVYELNRVALLFFDEIFKVRAVQTRVIEYNYSIDLAKFNNTNYVFLRDNTNKVYLIVYLVDGEFLESELQEEINKLDITEKLRLSYYNKYTKFGEVKINSII